MRQAVSGFTTATPSPTAFQSVPYSMPRISWGEVHKTFSPLSLRRYDTKYNDTQHNDTQHNDTQHNDTQHNDIQHNDTQCKALNYDTQLVRHSMYINAKWHYADCRYTECCYAECRGAVFNA